MPEKQFVAQATVLISAPPARVWEALTKPELIRQYLFDTQVTTDWQPGSPITYRGVWQGREYEDKGRLLEVVPEKRIVSTFWSALAGKPDLPENYNTIRYELAPEGGGTRLALTQDNNASEEDTRHAEQNWNTVLEGLKRLLEG
jgi:uncharacterized protein YndB with AHSA1/START domain